jgi:hypothetical protein
MKKKRNISTVMKCANGGTVDEASPSMTPMQSNGYMQAGQNILSGVIDLANFFSTAQQSPNDQPYVGGMQKQMYAMGGTVPVEVEDDEVAETPQGQVLQFKGATHAQGGIDVALPSGTNIFSDQLKIGDETMQERKLNRERAESRITKHLKINPVDVISKNSLKRTQQGNAIEEAMDMQYQKAMAAPKATQKFAYGGSVDDPYNPPVYDANGNWLSGGDPMPDLALANSSLLPEGSGQANIVPANTSNGSAIKPIQATPRTSNPNLTAGNIVGGLGSVVSAVAPLATTLANRKSGKRNINRYLNFGHDALATNDTQQQVVSQLRDKSMQEGSITRNNTMANIAGNTHDVNTYRANAIGADYAYQRGIDSSNTGYAERLNSILGQRTALQNTRDNYVAQGQSAVDVADKRDNDNFYSNINHDLGGIGTGIQTIGKNLNQSKQNSDMMAILPMLSKYGLGFEYDEKGNPVLRKLI